MQPASWSTTKRAHSACIGWSRSFIFGSYFMCEVFVDVSPGVLATYHCASAFLYSSVRSGVTVLRLWWWRREQFHSASASTDAYFGVYVDHTCQPDPGTWTHPAIQCSGNLLRRQHESSRHADVVEFESKRCHDCRHWTAQLTRSGQYNRQCGRGKRYGHCCS